VPVSTVIELTEAPDPARCCEQLAGLPYRLFLDSATPGTRLGRYSFLTADPVAVVQSKGARTEMQDALAQVGELLRPHRRDGLDGLPPFQGGAAGYLAYDWGRVLERLPESRYDDLGLPDAVLGIYDWVIAWDHHSSRVWLISTGIP
jgi:para-aminobenzoate synthetase component 1